MKEITVEMLNKLSADPEFIAGMRAAKTAEDILKVFHHYGVELTMEEFEAGYEQAADILRQKGYLDGDELTEEGMALVVGGVNHGVYAVGMAAAGIGIGLMATGPIGWTAVGLWAGGCAIATSGILLPGKKRSRKA